MIERTLGVSRDELTYERVVEQLRCGEADALVESEYLDFKQEIPEGKKLLDLARDIASFANAGGGVLLYGVAEDSQNPECAGKITDIALSQEKVTSLQRSINQTIIPTVPGVQWDSIGTKSDPQTGLLAVTVPRSSVAPHAVRVGDSLEFRVRKGRESRHMQEGELERAYRERARVQEATTHELDSVLEAVAEKRSTGSVLLAATPMSRGRKVYATPAEGVQTLERAQRLGITDLHGNRVLGRDVRSRFRRLTTPRVPVDFGRLERAGDSLVFTDEGVLALSHPLPSMEHLRGCAGWDDLGESLSKATGYVTYSMLNSFIAMQLVGMREAYRAFDVTGSVGGLLSVSPNVSFILIEDGSFYNVYGQLDEEARFEFQFELERLSDPSWLGRFIGDIALDIAGAMNLRWKRPVDDEGVFFWGYLSTKMDDEIAFWKERGLLMAPRD